MTTSNDLKIPVLTLLAVVCTFLWSAINPYDRATWWMEVAPVLVAVPIMLATYKNFRLTNLLYLLIGLHAVILIVGGHYTYARVPLFDVIRDLTGGERNNYDKIGHFAQGFIPAMVARELLIRTSTLRAGKWMTVLIVLGCLGISAIYEIIEWIAAVMVGEGAHEFLGTQGDEWDTQKDMAYAGIGAAVALLFLSKLHNRALKKLTLPA